MNLSSVNYQLIGNQLRQRRKEKGLSQSTVAQLVPCSTTYLSRIEHGTRPSLDLIIRLSEILDISLDDLFFLSNTVGNEMIHLLKTICSMPDGTQGLYAFVLESIVTYAHTHPESLNSLHISKSKPVNDAHQPFSVASEDTSSGPDMHTASKVPAEK